MRVESAQGGWTVLGLHPRGISDFFDALVPMGCLEREGDGAAGRYRNTPEVAVYLDRQSPRYIGGILEMLNTRLFAFWNDLPEALRTGKPQNEVKYGTRGMFEEIHSDAVKLEQFMGAMSGLSRANFEAAAAKFDYSAADFAGWCREVGFTRFEVIHLAGPSSAAVAYK